MKEKKLNDRNEVVILIIGVLMLVLGLYMGIVVDSGGIDTLDILFDFSGVMMAFFGYVLLRYIYHLHYTKEENTTEGLPTEPPQ